MIYRIFANKDTTITNKRRREVPQTASNVGASEILQLFKITPVTSSLSASLARILIKFDLAEFMSLTGSGYAPTTGSLWKLHLFNARHAETLPDSYDVTVGPVSQSWDEGKGIDLINFSDNGYANWDKSTSVTLWAAPGASLTSSLTASQHFDDGYDDIDVDVTHIINAYLSGGLTNNGFLISLGSQYETNTLDYYVKMFHSRQTHFINKQPYIESSWNESITTGSIQEATGSENLFISLINLKSQYSNDEIPIFRLFVRTVDYNPAVVLTGSSTATGLALSNAYYKITNDRTDDVIVPFGTGSVKTTRLSYDSNGNYFKFFMKNLTANEIYRITFLVDIGSQRQVIDNGFKFRVV